MPNDPKGFSCISVLPPINYAYPLQEAPMAGLSQDEMVTLYLSRVVERLKIMKANLGGVGTGESPDTQLLLKELSNIDPDIPIPPEWLLTIGQLFMAFLDVLVANNEQLANQISSVPKR